MIFEIFQWYLMVCWLLGILFIIANVVLLGSTKYAKLSMFCDEDNGFVAIMMFICSPLVLPFCIIVCSICGLFEGLKYCGRLLDVVEIKKKE